MACEIGGPEALSLILGFLDMGEVEGELLDSLLISLQALLVHDVASNSEGQLSSPVLEADLNIQFTKFSKILLTDRQLGSRR